MAAAAVVIAGLRPSWLPRLAAERQEPPDGVGTRVAWAGGCRSGWVLVGGGVVSAISAVWSVVSSAPLFALSLAALAALITLAFGSLRVLVGAHGVRVTGGIGWPHVRIPLAQIGRVEAIALNPLQWGGWGYRGSLRLVGRAAWVLRRGEALRLDLTDGRRFAVTVDHAGEAADVLNEWLSKRPPPSVRPDTEGSRTL